MSVASLMAVMATAVVPVKIVVLIWEKCGQRP